MELLISTLNTGDLCIMYVRALDKVDGLRVPAQTSEKLTFM